MLQKWKRPAVSPQAQSKNSVTLNAKRPWPSTLVLPSNCRQDVTRVLSSGEKLCKKQRMSFIRSLYDHFSLYTLYLTRDQLTAVAHLIIQTYPALKDQSVGTGYDSWFVQLFEKFRNERKHLVDDPEVILHKKIKTDTPDGQVMSSKLRRGAINWEPPYPEGEDEASMRKHKEALETEWRRRNPDKKRIEQGMLLTFPERRCQMNLQMPITEVKAEYPSLFDFTQIIAEFERILGVGTSVLGTFEANFHQVTDSILHVAKMKKGKTSEEIKKYLALLNNEYDDDGDDIEPTAGEKAEVAMAVLPLLLQGKSGMCKHTDFVEFISGEASPRRTAAGGETAFPFLICKGSLESHDRIYLVADKHIICDFEGSLVESALALLAGYYVFMFNYPAGLTNFFLFLQKCILHIQDGKKLPASVISLVNSFHEYQSVLATSCASRSV